MNRTAVPMLPVYTGETLLNFLIMQIPGTQLLEILVQDGPHGPRTCGDSEADSSQKPRGEIQDHRQFMPGGSGVCETSVISTAQGQARRPNTQSQLGWQNSLGKAFLKVRKVSREIDYDFRRGEIEGLGYQEHFLEVGRFQGGLGG